MAATTRNTVIISYRAEPRLKEYTAAAAVAPGELLEFATGEVQPHSGAAAAVCAPHFAVENPYTDWESATAAIDTDYADGDLVRTFVGQPGDELYVFLDAGENVTAVGAFLESAGNGALQVRTTGAAVARALEVRDNSGGGSPVRIKVEVL